MPEALKALLQGRHLTATDAPRFRNVKLQARHVRLREQGNQPIEPVGPLLHSIRDQGAPYNDLCPHWTHRDGSVSTEHCLSGCVATAIEQVMAYYRYPEALIDTLHGWTTEKYAIQDMLPGTRFDWDHYLLDYRDGWTEQQGLAIALPTLAAGMAVHMNYGLGSSSANVERAVESLQRTMGYGMVRYFERILYTPERWHAMVQHELAHGRPIVYTGSPMSMGGHAFNIDGMDAQGFYHVNWGYNGSYDGWYDLDWLSPWETRDIPENGFAQAFFCNQSMLVMHPSADAEPLLPEPLDMDHLGVVLKDVTFQRPPDLQEYVGADFHFVNTGDEDVTYTYEVMTYLPTDEEIFKQADYVGLAGLTLKAHEERTQRVYLQFHQAGKRILGISHDDVTVPFTMDVEIDTGTPPQLEWGEAEVTGLSAEEDGCTVAFSIPVANHAASGYAGGFVTFSIFPDHEYDPDHIRHYHVLTLPGGESETLQVAFSALEPDKDYIFNVRYPWTIRTQISFRTPKATAIGQVAQDKAATDLTPYYDLSGRHAHPASRGVLIREGRKRIRR